MRTRGAAQAFAASCRSGAFEEVGAGFGTDDAASVEESWPDGDPRPRLLRTDLTPKPRVRARMEEIGLYMARDGGIVEARDLYPAA